MPKRKADLIDLIVLIPKAPFSCTIVFLSISLFVFFIIFNNTSNFSPFYLIPTFFFILFLISLSVGISKLIKPNEEKNKSKKKISKPKGKRYINILLLIYLICFPIGICIISIINIYVGIIYIIFFIISLIIIKIIYDKNVEKIINHSKKIKQLLELNKIFENSFHQISDNITEPYHCNSKQKFDSYSLSEHFSNSIRHNLHYYDDIIKKVNQNIELYNLYQDEIKKLKTEITPEECKKLKVSEKFYLTIESNFYEQNQLNPTTNLSVYCKIDYTSPAGRNYYFKENTYSMYNIKNAIDNAKKQIKYENSEEVRRKKERNKVTSSLRYDVLKRDNFKCVICGRSSQDGVILHVDHIKPIAKGGKTTLDNLQTLCENCNLGKGVKE